MLLKYLVIFGLIKFITAVGDNAETIPDSLHNPTACNTEQHSYVCDVDGRLVRFANQTIGNTSNPNCFFLVENS